ncbi:MBL fold metallo-hydrolase [Deminuibacter soli]|uniref:MBL fold metallo-hydrolase n=1 Tax=Deminuibacter soli TaxID=2291815 RepID=A0A3E1NPQ9_9BACT|nr:MBL fold metallo-hydrolase [Deminuibacter soli]RFM29903.1 MBL fold metallo-hydrolase [Deminuibacter soli]
MIKVEFFTFSPFQENTYVLSNEKGEAIIIDPGCYFSAEQDTIKNHVLRAGLTPVQLLLTHCHLDHVFGLRWAAEQYKLIPWLHPDEHPLLQRAPESGLKFGLGFSGYTGPVNYLTPGETITLGTDTFTIIAAPGHSPGHVCFYCAAQHFVIGGDVLFRESIGRTDLPGGNLDQLLNNIRTQLFTLPEETVVYPGHGPSTTIGHEKKYNPYLQ